MELLKQAMGPHADILYGIAVCDYQLSNYKAVVNSCTELVNRAAKHHPGSLGQSLSQSALIVSTYT